MTRSSPLGFADAEYQRFGRAIIDRRAELQIHRSGPMRKHPGMPHSRALRRECGLPATGVNAAVTTGFPQCGCGTDWDDCRFTLK